MHAAPVNLESPGCQDLPELQLWRQVLLLAIMDCRGQLVGVARYDKRYAQQRAHAWIFSPRKDPGSFQWCCEVLGVDPGAVHRHALSGFGLPFSGKPTSTIAPRLTISL
jgi:hypothetical protein